MQSFERVVVLANRAPFTHERTADGSIVARRSRSGLVTASEPLVRNSGGVWVAHGAGSADRATVDAWDGVMVPPENPTYRLRRVWLTPEEEEGYYYGFANQGLWPLCHRVHVRPIFRSGDFDTYWTINARFAEAVCDEAQNENAVILVQDYHFALAPLMISSELPLCRLLAFWHIPWPAVSQLEICPWATYLLEGLLGSHLLGFQTQADCGAFIDSAEHFLHARVDRQQNVITYGGRQTYVRAYPASVEWPCRWTADTGTVDVCAETVRNRLKLRPTDRLVVGVDRMDYTKGLDEKLLAVEQLLDQYPEFIDSFVLVQVAQPSRQRLREYRELAARVRATADRVNRRFATDDWRPIILIESPHEPREVYRLLRAAEVCYVGSLHDGMNLVAKEFVSARNDERGVLVLSGFAGAANELRAALIINPYDLEQTANTLAEALRMSPTAQQQRMRCLRAVVEKWDARRWGAQLINDGVRLCRGTVADRTIARVSA